MSNNSTLMHLRPRNPHRAPLAPIHLSHLPSPTSLPTKRNAVAGPSETSKMRKVSTYSEKEGVETIKRSRAGKKEVTPRAKRFLETDEIGTGKSPARRLFTSDQSYGIAGAVLTPTSSRRSLSPSPASPSRSFSLHDDDNDERETLLDLSIPIHENGINIHDPGFIIFNETHIASTSTTTYTPPTPDSTRFTSIPALAPDAMAHIPSSPGSVMSYHTGYGDEEDQENIPPPSTTSFTFGTPSKGRFLMSPTSAGKGPGSESRQRRIMERSKLGLNSVIGKGDDERQEEGDDLVDGEGGGGEELTPGRRQTRRDVSSARRALLREVNRI